MRKYIHHKKVENDLREALDYYERKSGVALADRFFHEVSTVIEQIIEEPERFHFDQSGLRRANLKKFPFHILFFSDETNVSIQVIKHNSRHPNLGLRRKF